MLLYVDDDVVLVGDSLIIGTIIFHLMVILITYGPYDSNDLPTNFNKTSSNKNMDIEIWNKHCRGCQVKT